MSEDVVQARHAIEAIVYGYARGVDSADLDSVAELLRTCTVTLPGGLVLEGGEAVRAHYARTIIFYDDDEQAVEYRPLACSPRTRHVTTNLTYAFDGDVTRADTECYVTVLQTLGGASQIIAAGRYLDRFERSAQGWTIVERTLVLDNVGDMSRHARARSTPASEG